MLKNILMPRTTYLNWSFTWYSMNMLVSSTGHETMVCAVCLSIFLQIIWSFFVTNIDRRCHPVLWLFLHSKYANRYVLMKPQWRLSSLLWCYQSIGPQMTFKLTYRLCQFDAKLMISIRTSIAIQNCQLQFCLMYILGLDKAQRYSFGCYCRGFIMCDGRRAQSEDSLAILMIKHNIWQR